MYKGKTVSCGIIYNVKGTDKILIGHVTLSKEWSIPKGCIETEDVSYAITACREFKEETNISLKPEMIKYLGKASYRPDKDLALFYYEADEKEAKDSCFNAKCSSMFEHKYVTKSGEVRFSLLPEIDRYKFVDISELDKYVNKSMVKVINQLFRV